MANHFRLFSRPLVMDDVEAALSVTGTLPDYNPGDAFEGRLQINNAIGRCRVEVMPDTVLPPGYTIRVDNILREVVIKWDAYRIVNPTVSEPVLNGDFENGDDGNWQNHHKGWTIEDGRGKGGGKAAQFMNASGINNFVGTLVPVSDISKIIKLEASINHGSSSTGDLVVGPFLLWYNEARQLVRWTDPNQYVRGGANGDWHDYSYAEGAAGDPLIKYVAPGLTANRKKKNHACWVDDVRWNHSYTVGQQASDDFFVHIKVTDSLNRVAYWSGGLWYASLFLNSSVYPQYISDRIRTSVMFFSASTIEGLLSSTLVPESMVQQAVFLSAETNDLFRTSLIVPEQIFAAALFESASTKSSQIAHVQQPESETVTAVFTSASTRQVLINNSSEIVSLKAQAFFTGASTS